MSELQQLISDPLRSFFCQHGQEERHLRARLIRARDMAGRRAWRVDSRRASWLYTVASELANEWAFAPASIENLQEAIRAITRVYQAADAIERLESEASEGSEQ